MQTQLDERVGEGLARAVDRVRRHARLVLAVAGALTVLAGAFAATHLGVNADPADLFDSDLPFRRDRSELNQAIPAQQDAILAVLDAPTSREAEAAAADLAERVRSDPDLFRGAFAPGAGPFFERYGLLYLSLEELDDLADRLAAAQPFLAALARDPSLRGIFDQLALALRHRDRVDGGIELGPVLEDVGQALEAASRLEAGPRSFGVLLFGNTPGPTRRYVVVTPELEFDQLDAGRDALEALRALGERLRFAERGVRMRLTGESVLAAEEMSGVRDQATWAGLISFVLVATILSLALRSAARVGAIVITLAAGLVWTAGFAAFAVGQLNIISSAFAVLFIGLGVDYGIHFGMRHQELRARGEDARVSLTTTARGVGSSLLLCAITTAMGFLAFVPTGYRGVAELGVIAAAGMAISFVATLTVLPALLASWAPRTEARSSLRGGRGARLAAWPTRRPGWTMALTLLVVVGALALLPKLHFDANPLNLRDPRSEALQTFQELLDEDRVNPWSAEILAEDLEAAEALAERLEALPSVARVATLADWIPREQEPKLERIEAMDFMLSLDMHQPRPAPDREAVLASLRDFGHELRKLAGGEGSLAGIAGDVVPALEDLRATLQGNPRDRSRALGLLHASLVEPVADRIDWLRDALAAEPMTRDQLPRSLLSMMLARDGRARVQIFPRENLGEEEAAVRFVRDVRSVEPRATGAAVYMLEAKRTIVQALLEAFSLAAVFVAVVLALLWRSARDASLAMAPLGLAALVTAGAAVLFGIPINFANVIVLPLLLGIGVDSAIHLVHRHRQAEDAEILETSTSRAVWWSALTTMASFGTLGFTSHRGMASLGQLLTVGVVAMLLANLVFLPALLAWVDRRASPRAGRPLS